MKIKNKIISRLDKLDSCIQEIRGEGKRVVLCQGHFNVIHPGHLRFVEFAHEQGDFLVVAVQGEKKLEKKVRSRFFSTEERAQGVASLEYVDKVFIFNDNSFEEVIKAVKPGVYVLGVEFSSRIEEITEEINLIEKFGGKVIFSSGDTGHVSTEFLDKDFVDIKAERKKLFHEALGRQKLELKKIISHLDSFADKHILVIGDTIIDQYVACDALGMSSEAPVLVVREMEQKQFLGGAAIVAKHVSALGAKCSFVSLIGKDDLGAFTARQLQEEKIEASLVFDDSRSTTLKIRYMVGMQKILRVSRLNDHLLNQKMEEEIIKRIDRCAAELDGIIVSDYGYGLITPKVLGHITVVADKHNIKLFGDSQSSSQIGNILQYHKYFLLTPTEREARLALGNKYGGLEVIGKSLIKKAEAQNIVLTLGGEGFIVFKGTEEEDYLKTQHFPALNPYPADVVGAGDSLLAALAVSSCGGADLMEASAIGAAIASLAISKIGNTPVDLKELENYLRTI